MFVLLCKYFYRALKESIRVRKKGSVCLLASLFLHIFLFIKFSLIGFSLYLTIYNLLIFFLSFYIRIVIKIIVIL